MKVNNNSFKMEVADVFRFANGRTVFLGKVVGGPAFISKGQCEVWFDGCFLGRIEIEGEMLPVPKGKHAGLRSVSALTTVEIGEISAARSPLQLIFSW